MVARRKHAANVNQHILAALNRLIEVAETQLSEIENVYLAAKKLAVEQEAANAKLDTIINLSAGSPNGTASLLHFVNAGDSAGLTFPQNRK